MSREFLIGASGGILFNLFFTEVFSALTKDNEHPIDPRLAQVATVLGSFKALLYIGVFFPGERGQHIRLGLCLSVILMPFLREFTDCHDITEDRCTSFRIAGFSRN